MYIFFFSYLFSTEIIFLSYINKLFVNLANLYFKVSILNKHFLLLK